MFRKNDGEDITEEEYEKYIGPHRELTEKFLEESHSMSGRKKGMTGVPSLCGTGRTVSFPCI